MNVSLRRAFSIVLLVIMIAASIAGCAQIRKLTYPQDFVYLEKREVEALMRNMGDGVVRLNQLVAEASISDASTSDAAQQKKIVAEISALERIATRLSGGHKQTNQFFISDHIEQFISDLVAAKMFASINPPDYYKAGEITNSCLACHQFR